MFAAQLGGFEEFFRGNIPRMLPIRYTFIVSRIGNTRNINANACPNSSWSVELLRKQSWRSWILFGSLSSVDLRTFPCITLKKSIQSSKDLGADSFPEIFISHCNKVLAELGLGPWWSASITTLFVSSQLTYLLVRCPTTTFKRSRVFMHYALRVRNGSYERKHIEVYKPKVICRLSPSLNAKAALQCRQTNGLYCSWTDFTCKADGHCVSLE